MTPLTEVQKTKLLPCSCYASFVLCWCSMPFLVFFILLLFSIVLLFPGMEADFVVSKLEGESQFVLMSFDFNGFHHEVWLWIRQWMTNDELDFEFDFLFAVWSSGLCSMCQILKSRYKNSCNSQIALHRNMSSLTWQYSSNEKRREFRDLCCQVGFFCFRV